MPEEIMATNQETRTIAATALAFDTETRAGKVKLFNALNSAESLNDSNQQQLTLQGVIVQSGTRVDPAISNELYVLSRDRQISKDILTQFLKKHGKELYLFNKGLAEIPSSHEIMLDCESYYAVPTSLEPFIKQWISGA